jgi:hypothetical protein
VQKLLKDGSSKIKAYKAEVRFLCGVTPNSPFLVTLFERMQQIKNPDVIWVFCVKAYGVAENGASVPRIEAYIELGIEFSRSYWTNSVGRRINL